MLCAEAELQKSCLDVFHSLCLAFHVRKGTSWGKEQGGPCSHGAYNLQKQQNQEEKTETDSIDWEVWQIEPGAQGGSHTDLRWDRCAEWEGGGYKCQQLQTVWANASACARVLEWKPILFLLTPGIGKLAKNTATCLYKGQSILMRNSLSNTKNLAPNQERVMDSELFKRAEEILLVPLGLGSFHGSYCIILYST